ncbi:MAG: UDP-N-acetylglucosamine 4,6-dehydratase (inverting) [Hyphomicrobiales bacterium]
MLLTRKGLALSRNFSNPKVDFNGKSILVTGGTGSFGQAFIKEVVRRFEPARLIVFSRDELKQYEMSRDPLLKGNKAMRFFIGDVRDEARLEMALRDVEIVIHAAALKQVSAAEYNPFECIRTNVIGAQNIVQACSRTKVRKVIALSTDKAVSPINLYGASKLASDKIFIASNSMTGKDGTRFSVVRYGNVAGSRGSVVPLFKELVGAGAKSLPVTDARMTRFWIRLDQGVNFVMSSLIGMRGGEVFVPKLPSMRITDLCEAMAPGLPIDVVGIRPGEKLHESLITADDARNTRDCGDHYVIHPSFAYWLDGTGPAGRPVDERFAYASDTNEEWLGTTELREMLARDKA